MPFFNIDLRRFLFFAGILLTPFLFMTIAQPNAKELLLLKPAAYVAHSSQSLYFSFSQSVRQTVSDYLNLIDIRRQNRQLKAEVQALRTRQLELSAIRAENSQLRELLGFEERSPLRLFSGKIVAFDALSDNMTITVNRGSEHGVKDQMPVIDPNGVVGYVLEVYPSTATILLITDRYAVIDAVVARTGARGIVEGESGSNLKLRYLERRDDVEVGDLIVTSGLDQLFPKGYPVARVQTVVKSPYDVSIDVTATPLVFPHRLETVFFIESNKMPEGNAP